MTIQDALSFLDTHAVYELTGEFRKYEILVEYSNGDKVDAVFSAKQKARDFLTLIADQ